MTYTNCNVHYEKQEDNKTVWPSFQAYDEGKMKPEILRAFLATYSVLPLELELGFIGKDDTVWKFYPTHALRKAIERNNGHPTKALISFQEHKELGRIAVAKLYRSRKH